MAEYEKIYLRGSFDNVPDDWDQWWRTCSECGERYHASEGGCSCRDEDVEEEEEDDEEEEDEDDA